ncbi:MAG: hypothetical protein QNJ68_02795 [Microcoleaceae cyanobacterium MO_207.B10]|nr:hypothetical protein [Microcoleaceae cyanobacterium MO_207.B10]
MNAIKPEVIDHSNKGLIPKKAVREMLGIKTRRTFVKDYKALNFNYPYYTWGEVKQLLALRLFLSRGKSGIFGRNIYLDLLKKHTPQTIIASLGIDLEQEFKELQNQWIYRI